jgi:hypothetical protein
MGPGYIIGREGETIAILQAALKNIAAVEPTTLNTLAWSLVREAREALAKASPSSTVARPAAEKLFGQFALLASKAGWSPESIDKIARLQDECLARMSAIAPTPEKP